jgi:hypothetical protein
VRTATSVSSPTHTHAGERGGGACAVNNYSAGERTCVRERETEREYVSAAAAADRTRERERKSSLAARLAKFVARALARMRARC